MTPLLLTSDELARAANALLRGELVAFPTETVYGLGANALDARAVARVFEAKRRPHFDPLIVHISETTALSGVARHVPGLARTLMDAFWPGPLTIVLRKADAVPTIVTSGLDTVAVRVPQHPVARALITRAGVPVAAPSANRFGQLSPTRAEHVLKSLGDEVDVVVDGGPTEWGVESTIVDATSGHVKLLRFGALTLERLEEVVGTIEIATVAGTPLAPGQLASHYAPRTPLRILEELHVPDEQCAYLAFRVAPERRFAAVEVLSPSGDLREAAAKLFDALHRLDLSGASQIFAERVPDEGLGRAINDRLMRAAATAAFEPE